MDMNRFFVKDGKIALNSHTIIVRNYCDLEKSSYGDTPYYVDADGLYELELNFVPKHKLLEIVSKIPFDNTEYEWMEGIELRSNNPAKEIAEIASYGSIEAYESSLPESTDEFKIDTDYRLSKLELGL